MGKAGYTVNYTRHYLLRTIWLNPGISRIALARKLNLNKSTITKAITSLEELGIVTITEEGLPGPKGGRRPIGLTITPDFGVILGLEIRTDKYIATAVSFLGEILLSRTNVISWKGKSIETVLGDILQELDEPIKGLGVPLVGIGLGLPGTIDPGAGIIHFSGPLNINTPVDFQKITRKLTSIPVMIENDGNCCAWGELVFRKTKCPDNFLFLLGEFRPHAITDSNFRIPAIGLGLVLDRKIKYGEMNTSGEFQSVFHNPDILNSFSMSDRDVGKIEQNPLLMKDLIRELAQNVALIVNVLNLGAVIIGGNFEDYQNQIHDIFLEEIEKNWPAKKMFMREVLFSQLKELAVAYGAAAMFVEKMFSFPDKPENPGTKGIDLLEKIYAVREFDRHR